MGKLASIVKPIPDGCKFGDIITRHADTDDRATIADPNVTSAAVWEFVCENWEPVGRTTVKEHRNRVCSCYRVAA